MSPQDKAPAYQWYVRDYMSDEAVALMSYEQQGIYRALLDRQWLEGSIPADPSQLAAILRIPVSRFDKLWPRVAVKFKPVADGRLANGRMERERQKAEDYRAIKAANGSKGAAKRWQSHSGAIDSPLANDGFAPAFASAPASAPSGKHIRRAATAKAIAPGFLEFWMAYPKHKKRADAEKAWTKLAPDAGLQQQILAALAWQRQSIDWTKDGGQFIPLPASYLNGRRWEDEPTQLSPLAGQLSDAGMKSLVGLSAFRERMAAKAAGGEQ